VSLWSGHCVMRCTDSAYFDADSYDHVIPTAWIPLLGVNAHNGTLQVHTHTHNTHTVTCSDMIVQCHCHSLHLTSSHCAVITSLSRTRATVPSPAGGLEVQGSIPGRSHPVEKYTTVAQLGLCNRQEVYSLFVYCNVNSSRRRRSKYD